MPPSSRCLSFLNGSIAPYSSPRRLPSRGPQYLKAYGCLIKDLRKKKKEGSFLNVSTRGLNYLKTRIFGFPIKDFRHDEKGVTPECLKLLKNKSLRRNKKYPSVGMTPNLLPNAIGFSNLERFRSFVRHYNTCFFAIVTKHFLVSS